MTSDFATHAVVYLHRLRPGHADDVKDHRGEASVGCSSLEHTSNKKVAAYSNEDGSAERDADEHGGPAEWVF